MVIWYTFYLFLVATTLFLLIISSIQYFYWFFLFIKYPLLSNYEFYRYNYFLTFFIEDFEKNV